MACNSRNSRYTDFPMTIRNRFSLPKPQMLRQKRERDCSVPVFAALTGMSEDQIRTEVPGADDGKVSVDGWRDWLQKKGFTVTQREGCPSDVMPCVHLVASARGAHWVYRDQDGDVHDPSLDVLHMPADDERMRSLSTFRTKVLTLSVSRSSST